MQTVFSNVLDSVETLRLEEKEERMAILNRRLRDDKRAQLVRDIEEAGREFVEGKTQIMSVDEIMREISS